jgi:hypothetical protein
VFECADCATKFWIATQVEGPYPLLDNEPYWDFTIERVEQGERRR